MKVIFDIGHGQDTYSRTGAKGVPGLEEFEFNQAVVKHAKELAEANGIEVILTQPFDSNEVSLRDRVKHANNTAADILVSFHADANNSSDARGHWVFHWYSSKNGKRLAEIWQKYAEALPNPDRGIMQCKPGSWTNFYIVGKSKMPAILSEHAFMTNAADLKLLKSESFRKLCAEVAVRAVCEYGGIEFKNPVLQVDWKEKYYGLLNSLKDFIDKYK